jgi:hypothetical protein
MEQTPLGVKVQDMLYTLSPDILYTLGFASQDSTTIDLCLSVFPWARFRKHKGTVKMHTLLDLHGNIPTFTRITNGKVHEVNILDQLLLEAGAFYGMDRGYVDFERLYAFTLASAFCVVRAKRNVLLQRRYSHPVDKSTAVRSDQTVILGTPGSAAVCPDTLRHRKFIVINILSRPWRRFLVYDSELVVP